MAGWNVTLAALFALSILGSSCAPVTPKNTDRAPVGAAAGSAAVLKKVVLGATREQSFRPTAGGPDRVALQLVHVGLTVRGDQHVRHPRLADAVPTLENGLWRVLPDGQMETIWHLRDGARWHDGAPLTADDLVFSLEVGRELSAFGDQAYASIAQVLALDARTMTITWKEPFIHADTVLGAFEGGLLPRHLLEDAYRADKTTFLDLPYWSSEFIGAGPYRIREWELGVGLLLEANDQYVLGRPRIDLIEVKYLPDANTLIANLLAGTVDVTHNVGAIDLGLQLRDQWRGGTVLFNFGSDQWIALFPQFVDPQPMAVANLQVRRALAHAIDREEIVGTLVAGMAPVSHSFLSPNQAAYRDIEAALARYDHDPRRAAQLLEGQGYRRGADGFYMDEGNGRLELVLRGNPDEQAAKPAFAVGDYWQRLGVDATVVRLSPQQLQDSQYVATFPAFLVAGGANDVNALRFLHSSQTRLPSNNFRGGNRSRYMNPAFDALLETYFKAVPGPERTQALGQIVRHMADQVTVVGLYYNPQPGAISDRMLNVTREWPNQFITWNAHEWDVSPAR